MRWRYFRWLFFLLLVGQREIAKIIPPEEQQKYCIYIYYLCNTGQAVFGALGETIYCLLLALQIHVAHLSSKDAPKV